MFRELIRPIVIEGGNLNQSQLDQLRAQLGLPNRGRLEDSEDVDFGTRWLRKGPGEIISLSLLRDDEDGWLGGYCSSPIFRFELSCEGEQPPTEWIDFWRFQILQALADAGLRAV